MNQLYLYLSLIVIVSTRLFAQTVEREKLLTAYAFSIAKNIDWPNHTRDEYQFRIVTNNNLLINEFKLLARTKKLKGKNISCSFSESLIIPQTTDLVFIGFEFAQAVRSVKNQVEGAPMLIITDGFDDDRFIMINFNETREQTLSFEINRANIINQGLTVLDEIVLLGGSEVDVARLYRVAQDSIKQMENRVLRVQGKFDSLSDRVNEAIETINAQNKTIGSQSQEITRKQLIVNSQKIKIDSLAKQFEQSENNLDSLVSYLNSIRDEVSQLEKELDNQKYEVLIGNKILEKQESLIKERDQDITQRESKLKEMTVVVDNQQDMLWLLVLLSIVLVAVSGLTYWAYRARKIDAKKLAIQKEKLQNTLSKLQEAQSQLVQSEKMASLGVLTAGIAHEINNATNYVYSGIYVLKERVAEMKSIIDKIEKPSGKEKKLEKKIEELIKEKEELGYEENKKIIDSMITSIQVGAYRTAEIVKGLKIFSRSESESRTEVDIHEDINIALLLLESRYKNYIEIVKKFDKEVKPIYGYSGQLTQAFLNIIGNAIDALEEHKVKDPKIIIKTKNKKNFVEISIKDNGPGVPKKIEDKIFDPFFTTKKIGEGTGLGLSITFGIIEKHQGKINLESGTKGAEFIIRLPFKNIDLPKGK